MSHFDGDVSLGRVVQFAHRWLVLVVIWFILGLGLTAAVVFSLPRYYASHFSVFVTGLPNMAASMQVQSQLTALFGLSSGGSEYVTALLESDEIQMAVVNKLDLPKDQHFWYLSSESSRTQEKTLERLRKIVKIKGPQPPMQAPIRVSIETTSAELSYKITEELFQLLSKRIASETKNRSEFLETQLKKSRLDLDQAEKNLRNFAEQEGVSVALEIQGKEEYLAQGELRAAKIAAEVELKSLRARENAPGDITVQMTIQSEIAGLEAKIREISSVMSQRDVSLKQLPKQSKRYLDLVREVKSREKIFEIYLEHSELARLLDAGKSETRPFRIIDKPYQAKEPTKRQGLLKTLVGGILAAAFGLFWSLFREALAIGRLEAAELEPLPSQRIKLGVVTKSLEQVEHPHG